ncbi:MAG: substrate-binding domain-containing protein [Caldilineales bacterium]|nr:substrate-binding domain-containing protein [Caldilineales bacterium]
MIPSQREAFIRHRLNDSGVISVVEICSHCNCSPETARRDLRRLEESGSLVRTHGGAVRNEGGTTAGVRPNGGGFLEARMALSDRVDALIVTPSNTRTTHLLVDRCRRAGVPVIAEATSHPGARTLVAIDNYRGGFEAGNWVGMNAPRRLGENIAVIDVSFPQENTEARSRAFAEGLRHALGRQVKIVRVNGHAVRELARQITTDALSVNPDINVIFGVNDQSALGALDALRAAGRSDKQIVMVSVGLEGNAVKNIIEEGSVTAASIAMFPELVGRACIDAAVCVYHGCALPDRIITPFAIITNENLQEFYQREDGDGEWKLCLTHPELMPTAGAGYALLSQCQGRPIPKRIGYVEVFSSHAWYRNVSDAMRARSRARSITLEVVDASQDMALAIDDYKRAIGRTAERYVESGDTIILGAGESVAYLARALRGRSNITVITNSVRVVSELEEEHNIAVVVSGGLLRRDSRSFTGPSAEFTFRNLRADKAFFSVTGVNLEFGLSNTNIAEATVKQSMLDSAHEVFLLADSTKIGVESLIKTAPIERVHHLITDSGIGVADKLMFAQHGVDVIIAD